MKIKHTPLDAYVCKYGFVREKIERLLHMADNHFGHDADAIDWRHVGDLGRIEAGLDALLDMLAPEQP